MSDQSPEPVDRFKGSSTEDSSPRTVEQDAAAVIISPQAPEAKAMRDLESASAWLGLTPASLAAAGTEQYVDRVVHRYRDAEGPGSVFSDVSIAEDDESGAILEVTAISAHGPLRLAVTSFELKR